MAQPSMETHGQPFATPLQEGKFQPQKTPIKVSSSFYLFSADDTNLLFAPRSISACRQQFALDRDIFISFPIHRSQITEIQAPQLRCPRQHWGLIYIREKEKIQSFRLLVEYSKDLNFRFRLPDVINTPASFLSQWLIIFFSLALNFPAMLGLWVILARSLMFPLASLWVVGTQIPGGIK